jgi:hypothetical protein
MIQQDFVFRAVTYESVITFVRMNRLLIVIIELVPALRQAPNAMMCAIVLASYVIV